MRRWAYGLLLGALLAVTGCDGTSAPARAVVDARQVLTAAPELLETESLPVRQELFREVARLSQSEAGRPAQALVLFPLSRGSAMVAAAPGLEPRMDLLQPPASGAATQLRLEGRAGERWPEDRRESLQGLSEREAAELVARTLLAWWRVKPAGMVQVERAWGAPYAVAYVDGILRINPAFLYMAAANGPASQPAGLQ